MKSKGKRTQEIQEKKRELTRFDFLPKAKSSHQKSYNSLQDWSLYRASPKVKYHHALKKALNKEGKSGKRRKQNKKVNKKGERTFRMTSNFALVRKFALVRNFAQGCEKPRSVLLLLFCSSSAPDFNSIKLVLARIHRAWIDSTNLALKACKNYKISHKMRSEE